MLDQIDATRTNGATSSFDAIELSRSAGVWRLIHPEMALSLLSRNHQNRRLAPSAVAFYARQMTDGLWRLNPQPIIIDKSGNLVDGQHRLEAVVQSEVSTWFLIVDGVEPTVKEVVDTGRARGPGDLISIEFSEHASGANAYAAAAKILMIWDKRPGSPFQGVGATFRGGKLTNSEIKESFERRKELIVTAYTWANRLRRAGIPGGPGFWTAILAKFAELDCSMAMEFADDLANGTDLSQDSPIRLLRNRLIAMRQGRFALRNRDDVPALIVRAWNAWRQGRRLAKLIAPSPGDAFPTPV